MKLKMYFLLLALGALGLQSCNDDDDHLSSVPTELKNAFTEKYPSVSNEGNKRQLLHSGIPSTELRNLGLVYSERNMANDRDRPPLSGSAGSCEECIRKQ